MLRGGDAPEPPPLSGLTPANPTGLRSDAVRSRGEPGNGTSALCASPSVRRTRAARHGSGRYPRTAPASGQWLGRSSAWPEAMQRPRLQPTEQAPLPRRGQKGQRTYEAFVESPCIVNVVQGTPGSEVWLHPAVRATQAPRAPLSAREPSYRCTRRRSARYGDGAKRSADPNLPEIEIAEFDGQRSGQQRLQRLVGRHLDHRGIAVS
jgi:hypothetical protein